MAVSSKYHLSEGFQSRDGEVAIPGTEVATGRAVVVHLLVSGDSTYNRQLVESVGQVPEEHRPSVVETGVQDGVPFVVTASLPGNPSVKAWLMSIQRDVQDKPTSVLKAALPASDTERTETPETGAGEFTRFFSQPPGSGTTPSISAHTAPKPAVEPAIDPLAETNVPEAGPSEFTQFLKSSEGGAPTPGMAARVPLITPAHIPASTSVVPPPGPAPIPTVSASSSTGQSFVPGEFTRFLSQPTGDQPQSKTGPTADTSPAIRWGSPQTPVTPAQAAPVETPKIPPVVATPPAQEPEPGEFTRFFRGPSAAPTPSAPAQNAPPSPIQPPAMPGGMSSRVVNKSEVPPPAMPGGISSRVVNKSEVLPPVKPVVPPGATAMPPSGPGEFTRFYSEQAEGKPSTHGASSATPVVSSTMPAPSSAMPSALSDRVVNKAVPAPATPLNPDAGELTKRFEAPAQGPVPASPSAESLFWGKDAPGSAAKPPAYPVSGPGEFTKAMQSPLAAEPFRSHQPTPAKQPPGEFTRMMQGGGLQHDAPPRPDPRPAEPEAFPWKPGQAAGEYTKIFESAKEEHFSPAAPMPIHTGSPDLFSDQAASRPAPVSAGPSDYTQMMSAGSAPKPPAAAPATPKAPAPAPVPAKASAKPLIIIAGVLVFLAILLLVVFLVRR